MTEPWLRIDGGIWGVLLLIAVVAMIILILKGRFAFLTMRSPHSQSRPPQTSGASPSPTNTAHSPPSSSGRRWEVGRILRWAGWILLIAIIAFVLIAWVIPWLRERYEWRTAGNGNTQIERSSRPERSRPAPPADRERVEARVHSVNGVPVDPARTPRERISEGYEVISSHNLDVENPHLRLHCSETETGPERLWARGRPCVGGWISWSVSQELNFPLNIEYRLLWVEN